MRHRTQAYHWTDYGRFYRSDPRHIGHYGGLFYLGREGYGADRKPVCYSEKLSA